MKQIYDPNIFNFCLESLDRDEYIIGTYYVENTLPGDDFLDHLSLVQSMVLEGSTGTWMEVEEESPEVRVKLSGKLIGYYAIPTQQPDTKCAVVQMAFPIAAWEGNVPMMMLSFAGNCFAFSKNLRLEDVSFPEKLLKKFQGPKFGIPGVRKLLGVDSRPLSLHIIKPKMGMTPEQTANQVYQTALGGVDMVKDDEMSSDVYNCKFDDRVKAVMEALKKAEKKTGKRVIYFASITDEVDKINQKAKRAIAAGVNGLLFCYSAGFSALRVLAEDPEINVPVLFHPSHMISLLPRISFVVLAKIARICGADLVLSPTFWSSIPVAPLEESLRTCQVKVAPLYHIKPIWPMPAAGTFPGQLETFVKELGMDVVIPSGGGIVGHPMGYQAGAMAWQQAFEAVMAGVPLEEAAKSKAELKAALDQWGIVDRPHTPWSYSAPKYRPRMTAR